MLELSEIIGKLLAEGKGILAADESVHSANERLEAVGVEPSAENRRLYRELFLATPGIDRYLSGVILFEETLAQQTSDGVSFIEILNQKGIMPGIKVDRGLTDLPNFPHEKITEGLDGLAERLQEYQKQGLMFAKWRSVSTIGEGLPTKEATVANAHVLARYAGLCQQAGIVPIIEPEVLMDGDHDLEQSEEITGKVLRTVFNVMNEYRVDLAGLILKTSMVIPGKESVQVANPSDVAAATIRCLKDSVPEDVPGVVFLSGGQTAEMARENIRAIAADTTLPWQVTFSFARAIQQPALEVWRGDSANLMAARDVYLNSLQALTTALSGHG